MIVLETEKKKRKEMKTAFFEDAAFFFPSALNSVTLSLYFLSIIIIIMLTENEFK